MPPYFFNFLDAITQHPLFADKTPNIVVGRIMSFDADYYFMHVEVLENLSGIYTNTAYTVAGNDGLNCAVPLNPDLFHVNDTLIMNLIPYKDGDTDTVELNDCSRTFLFLSNGVVMGNIINEITQIPYMEFKSLLAATTGTPLSVNTPYKNEGSWFFPNPCKGILYIREQENTRIDIELLNITGKTIQQFNHVSHSISLESYAAGLYFIKIYYNHRLVAGPEKLLIGL